MSFSYFQAIAVDFDGTLTEDARPDDDVLAALGEAREAGLELILVTGRVLSDLLHVFPDVERWFDIIIGENGAVVRYDGISHALTAPVPLALDEPLVRRGVLFHRGQVLLGCHSDDELAVLQELRKIGADCQLVRNRDALMVLPSAISKGSGTLVALERLGVSYHNTIGIGDAENDLALLRQCELGVAVGNAVDSLKREADIVLAGNAGTAVAEFIRNRVLTDEPLPSSRRWKVSVGRTDLGKRALLPAARINLLIAGGSGVGKSYTAGLLAERLIDLDYTVCIVDPEGDHAPLGRLRNVFTVGGHAALPPPERIPDLICQQLGSVVVDLSLAPEPERHEYANDLLRALSEERRRSGLPHWTFVDEAHERLREEGAPWDISDDQKGLCLVTYRPKQLGLSSDLTFDYVMALAGEGGLDEGLTEMLPRLVDFDHLDGWPRPKMGQALLMRRGDPDATTILTLDKRLIEHVRHWHKYASSHLPSASVFRFRSFFGQTGAQADNLAAFRRELLLSDPGVLHHHASHGDFSQWLQRSIRDETLAKVARELEERSVRDHAFERLRRELVEAIEDRYLT